jgi:regulator of sigma E protease
VWTVPDFFSSLIWFLLVLGPLVFIHELGHFLVAKWLGIRVEVFSLGFGKRIWGFKRGNTDYRIAILPLGGYVKMAGENIGEEHTGAPDEFLSHSKWHRFLVAVAGPVMNILTAIAIPALLYMFFFQVPAYKAQPPVVSGVVPETTAAQSDLRSGDRILSVNGVDVETWGEVDDRVMLSPGHTVPIVVDRGGQRVEMPVLFDSITVNGEKIGLLGVRRDPEYDKVLVDSVVAGMPAEAAGLRPGDTIVSINGAPVWGDRESLVRTINANPNVPVTLTVKRGAEPPFDLSVTPVLQDDVGRIGLVPAPYFITTRLGPIEAIQQAVATNVRFVKLTGAAFAQIFAGQRSVGESLAGPIGISRIAGEAAKQGTESILILMAMLSLNLGIFNLLPIPVLDGGMIFMLAIEGLLGLFGLKMSMVVKERMINVGLVLIVLLMGFVIFNDIQRTFLSRTGDSPPAQQQPAPQQK